MPFYKRPFSPGQLQFITPSTYRRAPLFLSERFCRCFVRALERVATVSVFLTVGSHPRDKPTVNHKPIDRGYH